MTGTEYQQKAMRTAQGLTEWDLLQNGVMGLCGEAGECIDLVKKYRFQGHRYISDLISDLAMAKKALEKYGGAKDGVSGISETETDTGKAIGI